MNQNAMYLMFAAAVNMRLSELSLNEHNRHMDFDDFADAFHAPQVSVYFPKGSRASSPVCAVLVDGNCADDPFIGFARSTRCMQAGYKLHLMEAGYVRLANSGEVIALRTEHEDRLLREQSKRLH